MAKKWSNENLPGALHYVTAVVGERRRVFNRDETCVAFMEELQRLRRETECKLIAFVLTPDHLHFIVNPRGGRITDWCGSLKSKSAIRLMEMMPRISFVRENGERQFWQESFKSLALWSNWMTWQKIHYIHNNPVRAKLAGRAAEYRWTSFRSFYEKETDPLLEVDRDWWWPEDVAELARAMAEKERKLKEIAEKKRALCNPS